MKKVSVIIPTYNRGKFLRSAVKSIINQNYPDIEIIIVDDGSTDDTERIVKELIDKYPFIMYTNNLRTKGPSGARNTGIMKASGAYLAFLDSDDIWSEEHLQNGVKLLEKNADIDVLFGNYAVVDYYTNELLYNFFDQKRILPSLQSFQIAPGVKILKDNMLRALLQENFFSLGTSIIKKTSVSEHAILLNESLLYAEDRDFAVQLYKKANASFAFREMPTYIAYRHNSNLTTESDIVKQQQHIENIIFLYKTYLCEYKLSDSERKIATTRISRQLLTLSYIYRKNERFRLAFIKIVESVKYALSFRQLIELCKIVIEQLRSTLPSQLSKD
jgi:glycosyltransferase involved in cell wall biosynthesis